MKEINIPLKAQERLSINVDAEEHYPSRHLLCPKDYTADDVVNIFRREGYIKGKEDGEKRVCFRLYNEFAGDERIYKFIKDNYFDI